MGEIIKLSPGSTLSIFRKVEEIEKCQRIPTWKRCWKATGCKCGIKGAKGDIIGPRRSQMDGRKRS